MSAPQRSTYKVVRAVSEVECIGFFDSVNSYDNAFVSVGPCHWTLGIVPRAHDNVSEGELCGYLAYLKHASQEDHRKLLTDFGVDVDEQWVDADGQPRGSALYKAGSRKFAGWVALQNSDGSFSRLAMREAEGDYFKTWHWFYRFVAAGRSLSGYRARMWDMARMRLRDLLSLPMADGTPLGTVYSSERALAMILRWHIRFPAHVANGGRVGSGLNSAFEKAKDENPGLEWDGNPPDWGDQEERALAVAIRDRAKEVNTGLGETISYVWDWPRWASRQNRRRFRLDKDIGRLNDVRNSFAFDDAGLPPQP